jgi:hypothetical protein
MFPFKSAYIYRVKKSFKSQRSNELFNEGMEVQYVSSTTNIHEGIEICQFRDRATGRELIWHADQYELEDDSWKEFLEKILPVG